MDLATPQSILVVSGLKMRVRYNKRSKRTDSGPELFRLEPFASSLLKPQLRFRKISGTVADLLNT